MLTKKVSIHVRTAARTTLFLLRQFPLLLLFQSTSGPQPGRHILPDCFGVIVTVSIHVRTAARTTHALVLNPVNDLVVSIHVRTAARTTLLRLRSMKSVMLVSIHVRTAARTTPSFIGTPMTLILFQSTSGPQPGRHLKTLLAMFPPYGFNPRPDRSPDDTVSKSFVQIAKRVSIHVRTAARTTRDTIKVKRSGFWFQSTSGPQPGRHKEQWLS